jgi:4-amino-4-deoxy-L-arabinose transferase-like glycosyltransferase
LHGVFGHPFFVARAFNVLCASAAVALVFAHAFRSFASSAPWRRFGFACLFGALFLFSPLFIVTSGKAWNHDLPMLLIIAAILLHLRASSGNAAGWIIASGVCVGLAIGTRLTFAPLAAPFFLAIFFLPLPRKKQCALAAMFGAAVIIALVPVWWYLATARDQFLFGNFEFPRLRLLDPSDERAHKTVKLWRKLRFFAKEIIVTNPGVFLAFVLGLPGLWRGWRSRSFESVLFALVIPFLLFGCFAPTRYQYQHFYPVAPVFLMAAACGFAKWPWLRWKGAVVGSIAAVCLFSAVKSARDYSAIKKLAQSDAWVPMEAHALGLKIKTLARPGKVLTFAPIFALEGGMEIYPELATGLFAARLAHLVPEERRRKMHLVAAADLPAFLDADPPKAILLGFEAEESERPLRDYAQAHGFRLAHQRKRQQIWVAPER